MFLFFTLLNSGSACMCGGDTNLKNYNLDGYEAIFLGELRGAKHFPNIPINQHAGFPAEVDTFYIIKVWKGDIKPGQEIRVYQFGIGCTNALTDKRDNARFIIAATRKTEQQEGFEGMEKFLLTSLCDPIISEKEDSLEFRLAVQLLDSRYSKVEIKRNHGGKRWLFSVAIFSILLIVAAVLRKLRNYYAV